MNVTEIIKDITVDDQFFEMLHCQNEILAGLSVDKPNNYIMTCMSKLDDLYKVREKKSFILKYFKIVYLIFN